MTIAADILKSEHVGIRELKVHLSEILKKGKPVIITDRGTPVDVILPYSDMIEIIDIIDELMDLETIKSVEEGREAIKKGVKGIPVSGMFKRIREKKR